MDLSTSPRITNLVVKVVLCFDITLDLLTFVFDKVDYRPERFNGAIVKEFGCTLLVFRNGKINIVGAKSMDMVAKAVKGFCNSMYQPYEYEEMLLVNLVATGSVGKQVNLTKIAQQWPKIISYHPELYPAAYYSESKDQKPKVSIFHTGKLVFTGFKSVDDVNDYFARISILLE
jgi:TATA-box binding protein (TBP) (component of TFIID and TFIIIB)